MTGSLPQGLTIRHTEPDDHARIIGVMPVWWNGRDLTHMVSRLFLVHFCNTSFVVETDDELVAFLIGFMSPGRPDEGYIHFAGVHPDYRGMGIGSFMYGRFEQLCIENGRKIVCACTSPVNRESINYHIRVGFEIENGNAVIDGVPVTLDYNKPGDPKVLFKKTIRP